MNADRKTKICVSVGHGRSKNGGFDPGACSGGLREFDIAREIAKYLAEYLRSAGFETELINYGKDMYLTDRIGKINAGGYDFALEIHLNAGKGRGCEVYYPAGSQEGRRAAALISAAVAEEFSVPDRGAKTRTGVTGADYFGIIRDTKPLTLLVETVFIDSPDVENVASASGRDACARAISKAVGSYFDSLQTPLRVGIVCDTLNVRSGPGTQYKINSTVGRGGVYTVTERRGGWGRLKSGAGWINLGGSLVEMRGN
ncbi:MAG: N-acetylmuramoyl-L-alanine amidase [Clostridia bacterium]|nr:N-acetylmuramoyl-L-alanine amidase [Clostridia bacterium]